MTRLREHWPLLGGVLLPALLLIAYLGLAVAYSLASPLYEPTDEIRHFRYVRHLVVYRSLPLQEEDPPRVQSHHPPLYYALGALVSGWIGVAEDVYYEPAINPYWAYRYWEVSDDNKNQYLHGDDERFPFGFAQGRPFHGVTLAVRVVRWITVLIGAGTVWLTYRAGRRVFPGQPALALAAAALVAFNPQFIYLSGAVNNDIPAALCSVAVLLMCIRLVQEGPNLRTDVQLGILYGLALLTKFNLLALGAIIALAYVLAVWRTRDRRALVRGALVVLGLASIISGWWFWRNQVLYGDPTGMKKLNELWAGRPAAGNWWAVWQSLPYLWSSLWGRFGYGQVPLPQDIYQGLLALCTVAAVGLLLPRRGPSGSSRTAPTIPTGGRESPAVLVLLGATVLTFTAVVFYYIMIQPAGAMGRFLFPGLPALALIVCLGLSRFFPRHLVWVIGAIMALGMATLAIFALVGVLGPAFARPHLLTEAELGAVPNPTDVRFAGIARLLGYQVRPTHAEPGGMVEVTLYWQALARPQQRYAVFVHLLSDVGTMVAQRDTYHGLGRYPTDTWQPGVAFADTYRVHVPETAYAPDRGFVQVGMYLPGGPRLTTSDGRDALRLETVEIQPRPGEIPNPLQANFGDQAALVGYTLDRRAVRPGETVRLTLYWQALISMETDYRVFAHVLGVENQVWANSDGWPAGGNLPTGQWQQGQIVEDIRDLNLGLTTPAGFYDIEVGMYVPGGDRLPVVAEDGHWLDSRVLLSKVRVVSEQADGQEQPGG